MGSGIPLERRHKVLGIEDSSAGVVSIKLADFSCRGISDGIQFIIISRCKIYEKESFTKYYYNYVLADLQCGIHRKI